MKNAPPSEFLKNIGSIFSSEDTSDEKDKNESFVDNGDGLPVRDLSGKVHGTLPSPEQLSDYETDELEDFQDELRGSTEERIKKNTELGHHKPHAERQALEHDLISSIDKILENRND